MTDVQSADGVIHQFPDGTSPAVIDRAMLDYARRGNADRDADRRVKGFGSGNRTRAFAKGTTFGFNDELDAAGAAFETGAHNALNRALGKPDVGYSMGDAYGAVMDANARADAAYSQAHPFQSFGFQVGGGLLGPGMATAGRWIAGGRNLLAATGRSAVVGAATGAVAGAGNASGGLEDRAVGAGKGAVVGAVVGAAVPGAARIAQSSGRAVNAALGQPFGGATRGAIARVREALQQDGLTEAEIRQAVGQWQRSGVTPEFLNVVGENTRALFRAAGGQAGTARSAAQRYRDTTVASIPNRAIERTRGLTPGETRTPARFAEETTAARQTEADQNYGEWSDAPVQIPEAIQDMLADSSGRSIIARARADAIENQDWGRQVELDRLLRPTEDGQLPRISAGTIERLVIAARERGAAFAQRGNGSRARGAYARREQLNNTLSDVPEAQPSRARYREQSQAIDAAQEGPSVLGPTSEFEPSVAAIADNPQAMTGARIRERQALRDKFGTRDQVGAILGDIANAPDVRVNLNQLYGEAGDRFADSSQNLLAKQAHANYVAPNTGSQTASRGTDTNRLFGAISNAFELAHGSLRPIIERLARGLTMTEAERGILVNLGIGSPQEALRVLAAPRPAVAVRAGGAMNRLGATVAPAVVSQGTANR